jgi:hypothetical protein
MKAPLWIFSIRYAAEGVRDFHRRAVVGPAHASTVEAALRLACVPENVCAEIRSDPTVRSFVEGGLDAEGYGCYVPCPMPSSSSWLVCLGPVHEVMPT